MTGAPLANAELDMLRAVFQRHPEIEEVQIFGSRAKGTHTPSSDVDLAVRGDLNGHMALATELDELPLPYLFDVIALCSLSDDEVRSHIERVGRSIYIATR